MTTTNVQLLEKYAYDNYDLGGHWVAECWDTVDYQQLLYRSRDPVGITTNNGPLPCAHCPWSVVRCPLQQSCVTAFANV